MANGHIVRLMFHCAIILYITLLVVEPKELLSGLEEHMDANRRNQRRITDCCLQYHPPPPPTLPIFCFSAHCHNGRVIRPNIRIVWSKTVILGAWQVNDRRQQSLLSLIKSIQRQTSVFHNQSITTVVGIVCGRSLVWAWPVLTRLHFNIAISMFNEQRLPYSTSDMDETTPHLVQITCRTHLLSTDLAKPLWGTAEIQIFSNMWYKTKLPDVSAASVNKFHLDSKGQRTVSVGWRWWQQTPVTVT